MDDDLGFLEVILGQDSIEHPRRESGHRPDFDAFDFLLPEQGVEPVVVAVPLVGIGMGPICLAEMLHPDADEDEQARLEVNDPERAEALLAEADRISLIRRWQACQR